MGDIPQQIVEVNFYFLMSYVNDWLLVTFVICYLFSVCRRSSVQKTIIALVTCVQKDSIVRKISNRGLSGQGQVATLFTMGILVWGWENWRKFLVKVPNFKTTISLKLFDWFWRFKFWEKALDVCFHSGMAAGPSDPYNRCNTTATSFGQRWNITFWAYVISFFSQWN